jgi:hypothetical protein
MPLLVEAKNKITSTPYTSSVDSPVMYHIRGFSCSADDAVTAGDPTTADGENHSGALMGPWSILNFLASGVDSDRLGAKPEEDAYGVDNGISSLSSLRH